MVYRNSTYLACQPIWQGKWDSSDARLMYIVFCHRGTEVNWILLHQHFRFWWDAERDKDGEICCHKPWGDNTVSAWNVRCRRRLLWRVIVNWLPQFNQGSSSGAWTWCNTLQKHRLHGSVLKDRVTLYLWSAVCMPSLEGISWWISCSNDSLSPILKIIVF